MKKHDFSAVIQIQPMETLFHRDVNGEEHYVKYDGQSIELADFHDGQPHITKHTFSEGETVHPDEVTAMVCAQCGCTVWIQGTDLDFAQECAEKYGIPTCESQYVIDVMMS
jgi:hypothetical protein